MLSFYGVAGLTLALYNWLTIVWDVGSGYNEFNKEASSFSPRVAPAPNAARAQRLWPPAQCGRALLTCTIAGDALGLE